MAMVTTIVLSPAIMKKREEAHYINIGARPRRQEEAIAFDPSPMIWPVYAIRRWTKLPRDHPPNRLELIHFPHCYRKNLPPAMINDPFAWNPRGLLQDWDDCKGLAELFPTDDGGRGSAARQFTCNSEGNKKGLLPMRSKEGVGGALDSTGGFAFGCNDEIGIQNQAHGLFGAVS